MIVANQFKPFNIPWHKPNIDCIVSPAGSGEFVVEEAQVVLSVCAVNLLDSVLCRLKFSFSVNLYKSVLGRLQIR